MSIAGIAKNLLNKGPKGVLEIRKERQASEQAAARARTLSEELLACCADRADGELSMDLDSIAERERELRDACPQEYGEYKLKLQAHYLKVVLPARYARQAAVKPVRDKVVFLEKNRPDNAPNGYISKALQEQGKYEVVKMSMGINGPSRIGSYEKCVAFVEEAADAKAIFVSSGSYVMSQFDLRPETKLIQLWHGLGMFKKCGYSTVDSKGFGSSASRRDEYNSYRNYSYVCLPSMEQAWTFEDSMRIPADSGILVPVGVSRTDVFYKPKFAKRARKKLLEAFPQIGDRKIIFYAPTYRGHTSAGKAPKALDVDAMARELADDYVLLIKHHSFAAADRPPIPAQWEGNFAFDMNANKVMGIEKLLAVADVFITDYSSLGFEFALMERPMLFFAFDLSEYLDQRGMYWDYDDITPGPVCKTTQEMIDCIQHVDERFDKAAVQAFKEKYVGACDGHATERTIALIDAPENPRLK